MEELEGAHKRLLEAVGLPPSIPHEFGCIEVPALGAQLQVREVAQQARVLLNFKYFFRAKFYKVFNIKI